MGVSDERKFCLKIQDKHFTRECKYKSECKYISTSTCWYKHTLDKLDHENRESSDENLTEIQSNRPAIPGGRTTDESEQKEDVTVLSED